MALTESKKVLVIDDDKGILDVISLRLESAGYKVQCATNGNEAISLLEEQVADLILLDIVMPEGMDGFQFFKTIKEHEQFARIPVVVLSGRPAMKSTFEMLGADSFLAKPFDGEALLSVIAENLESVALVVGSNQAISESLERLLKKAGYKPEITPDPADINDKVDQVKYRLITLHVELFGDDLATVIGAIRQSAKNKKTPIVLYTNKKKVELGSSEATLMLRSVKEKISGITACELIEKEFTRDVFHEALARCA